MELRYILYAVWGVATTLIWAAVLSDAYGQWKEKQDQRAKRELLGFAGLFLTALGATVAILAVAIGEPGQPWRQALLLLALGMFTGAGIVFLSARRGRYES